MEKTKQRLGWPRWSMLVALGLLVSLIVLIAISGCSSEKSSESSSPQIEKQTLYTNTIDRCKDSGEYGKQVVDSVRVWERPGEDRGRVLRTVNSSVKVVVLESKRLGTGPGSLWYRLEGGGWVNDYWVASEPVTMANLDTFAFKDCWGGVY